ncbi:hypothetical protein Afil01_65930 [Actinorhabdospora filicis]|uniref:ABC transmembrane type-1 domain-containing protein n=1 Tax=Actinorhabdospora filicis TaxID=1785913 RepID=A0A9W6WDN2_9ACTN|nr:ABC transporter permease subunit [Actinorhabdospora filicis]GLZ81786.1 hypothetical protein Afil01_65930 [Actinorhabdospora filicis]
MLAHTARRLALALPALLLISVLAFGVAFYGPAAPAPATTAERERLYLDRPVPERYWTWLTGLGGHGDTGLLRGRWGPSVTGESVGRELGERVRGSARLLGLGVLTVTGLAVAGGVAAVAARHRTADAAVIAAGLLGLGAAATGPLLLAREAGTRPVLLLGGLALAALAVRRRAPAAETGLVDPARVLGVRHRVAVRRHAVRASLTSGVTAAASLAAGLLAALVVAEGVLARPGFGAWLPESLRARDAYAVAAWLLVAGAAVIAVGIAADLTRAALDPRVRHG